jgi:hypothetical protein
MTARAVPTLVALRPALSAVLGGPGPVRIVRRTRNLWASYYASEIVDGTSSDGQAFQVLVKYGPARARERGHRLGPGYEAAIYRDLLRRVTLRTATFHGVHHERSSSRVWLVIEYLADATRACAGRLYPDGLPLAAAWIGAFHRQTALLRRTWPHALNQYDAPYLEHWMRRGLRLEREAQATHAALPTIERVVDTALALLTSGPRVVIHGDYYADNVLYANGAMCPIDWERTGVGGGELDLAALVLGWDEPSIEASVRAYTAARWPAGAPRVFTRRFAAARMYAALRLLAERPAWPSPDVRASRLADAATAARELGSRA